MLGHRGIRSHYLLLPHRGRTAALATVAPTAPAAQLMTAFLSSSNMMVSPIAGNRHRFERCVVSADFIAGK
jgi:hypothetical protein